MTHFGAFFIVLTPILVLIACIVWTRRLRAEWNKTEHRIWDDAPSKIWVAGCFLCSWLLFWVIFVSANRTEKFGVQIRHERIANIVSLSNGSQIHSSFVLGSGSVNEHLHYFFYKYVGYGSYRLDKIRADGDCGCGNAGVLIREDATGSSGYIEKVYSRPWRVRSVLKPFFIPEIHERLRATYIHVPPGTIVQQFSLDVSKL